MVLLCVDKCHCRIDMLLSSWGPPMDPARTVSHIKAKTQYLGHFGCRVREVSEMFLHDRISSPLKTSRKGVQMLMDARDRQTLTLVITQISMALGCDNIPGVLIGPKKPLL